MHAQVIAMLYCLLLLIASQLYHATCSTVYYVIPDDHYTTNNNTYTLQHYLNNVNKYFTSHTQLHFLPGQYYLDTDLIIQHVSNLSLIGNRTNEVINSVIKCTSPAGIVVVGSSNIVIANIVMNECGNDFNNSFITNQLSTKSYRYKLSLLVQNCQIVTCRYFQSIWYYRPSGIKFLNTLGNTLLLHVVSPYLKVWHSGIDGMVSNMTMHTIHIEEFQAYGSINYTYAIDIQQNNSSCDVTVMLQKIKFKNEFALCIRHVDSFGQLIATITNCSFSTTVKNDHQSYKGSRAMHNNKTFIKDSCEDYNDDNCDSMIYSYSYYSNLKRHTKMQHFNRIEIVSCNFTDISKPRNGKILHFVYQNFNDVTAIVEYMLISITDCLFYNNYYMQIALIGSYSKHYKIYYVSVFLRNVTISSVIDDHDNALKAYRVHLNIENLLLKSIFFESQTSTIIEARHSNVEFNGYNEFLNNTALAAIFSSAVYVQENTILNFTLNDFNWIIIPEHLESINIQMCSIQYISDRGNLDSEFQLGQKLNYSIVLYENTKLSFFLNDLMHCAWDSSSVFVSSLPVHVNQKFIIGDNSAIIEYKKRICLCANNVEYNCYKGIEGPFYPGQTVSLHFALVDTYIKAAHIEIEIGIGDSNFKCDNDKLRLLELQLNECGALEYTIKHNGSWCELSLKATPISVENPIVISHWTELYTILLHPCPKGFSLHAQAYCQCDPILSSHIPSLTNCDIDHQTIPRPANTWISAHTINNLHSYHVSLHCPFDYCLPHSSQLNLSTPDSQCQFNRSGDLCGQCQRGLSTVFGSSQCKHCFNIYLLIIIPIGIIGLAFILMLFTLNLTVTNGDINPFLLYINIISINAAIFFPTGGSVMYTFTSIVNLDLGIETCFYNGMDDYTKTWLQLVFPIYLIFIAILLIIASRYSTTIQRLTARRALPVLATLFLLSYTKVLLTVSNVLFSYTSITHLPSNRTTLVWSVGTSVPLFGVKFTILFIVCLILFLILVPFNVVLIFTKKLSYFKVVTNFKPLLDAYQGPYKIKFHYWTGLQLLIRTIFFGLTALDRNINLTAGILFIGILIWLQGKMSPFKGKLNNNTESLCLFNLLVIFVISLYTTSNQIVVNVFISLAMIHLLCIVLWHAKNLIWNNYLVWHFPAHRFTNYFLNIFRHKEACKANHIELVNKVPEVAFNYTEFQEPLVGI